MYRRKIFTTGILLLVCLTMLVWSSFAWLSLSVAPEILGVETRVSANGSLEIALLSDVTYMDPSKIQVKIGDSAVNQETAVSNLSWGNIVDLSGDAYGMDKISLLPSQLTVFAGESGGAVVGSNLLGVPEYQADGRISQIVSNTVSAVYDGSEFTYYAKNQNYGVRAIGVLSGMSPQQAALANARTAVPAYQMTAGRSMETLWTEKGKELINICLHLYYLEDQTFTDTDVAFIRGVAGDLYNSLGYIDSAIRQGLVGYLASITEDADTFRTLRSTLENTRLPLSAVLSASPVTLPEGVDGWIKTIDQGRVAMQSTIVGCNALKGGSYRAAQLQPLLESLLTVDKTYLNENLMSTPAAYSGMTADNVITLTPDSGPMAVVAEYAGRWSAYFSYDAATHIEVDTMPRQKTPYLQELSSLLDGCVAAGSSSAPTQAAIKDRYGFVMDFAFRCNRSTELLLQTQAANRVDQTPTTPEMEGGGSYMTFTSEQLTEEQIVSMMDAIRIAFVDSRNNIIATAKLNTSNYETQENAVSAPIYLYEYSLSPSGTLVLGERLKENNVVTTLYANDPLVLSAVVWLDGEYVDNSYAAITKQTMSGTMNLQFASSQKLVSADMEIG